MAGLQGLQEAHDRAYDLWDEAVASYEAEEVQTACDLYAEALEIGLGLFAEELLVELTREVIICCGQAQRYDDAARHGWKTLVRLERENTETGPDHRRNIIRTRYVLAFGLSGTESGRRFNTERFEDARSLFGQNIDSLLRGAEEHDQLTETDRKSLLLENREALAAVFFNLAENSEDEIVAKDFYRQAGSLWEEVMSARDSSNGDPVTLVHSIRAQDYYAKCLLHQERYENALAQLLDLRTKLDRLDLHQFQPEVQNDLEQIRQMSIISTVDAQRALQRLAEKESVSAQPHLQSISSQQAPDKAAKITADMEGSSRTQGGWNFWPSAFRLQTSTPVRPNSASPTPVTTAPGTFPVDGELTVEATVNKSGAITTEDLPARVLNSERAATPLTPPENIQRSRSANGPIDHSSRLPQAAFAPVHASGMHSNNTVSGDARAHFGNSFAQNSHTFNFFNLTPDELAAALKGTSLSDSMPPRRPP